MSDEINSLEMGGLVNIKDVPGAPETQRYSQIDALIASAMKESHSFEELLVKVDKKVGILRGDPNIDIPQLERDLDFVVNFLLLDKGTLEGQKPDIYGAEASARIQHQMVHRVYYASSPRASAEYIDSTYGVIKNTATRIEQINRRASSNLGILFQGARNQLAIERVLIGGGFGVFQPDYSQDPAEVDEEDNEVLQLDVKEGVDMITVGPKIDPNRPRTIILLDAKGRNAENGVTEPLLVVNTRVRNPETIPNLCLRRAITEAAHRYGETDLSRVFRAKLFIPTAAGRSFISNNLTTQEVRDTAGRQSELRNFGRLQTHIAIQTLDEAKSIEKYS